MFAQRTVARSVHAIGIGVHSGKNVALTIRPAPVDTGIQFICRDTNHTRIAAHASNVSDTTLSTTIAAKGAQIATVEHLMSALWGAYVDNALVEVKGGEVPIMDGSAANFMDLLNNAGFQEQSASRKFIRVIRQLSVTQGDASAMLVPFDGFKARYEFVADHLVYNRYPKRMEMDFGKCSYSDDIAYARSFGLVAELSQAQSINRCLGSSLENSVGVSSYGILNPEGLRYTDEFVKHKILDAIGDLYLLGLRLMGEFRGYMSGHALNNKLAQALFRCPDAWELVEYSVADTQERESLDSLRGYDG